MASVPYACLVDLFESVTLTPTPPPIVEQTCVPPSDVMQMRYTGDKDYVAVKVEQTMAVSPGCRLLSAFSCRARAVK